MERSLKRLNGKGTLFDDISGFLTTGRFADVAFHTEDDSNPLMSHSLILAALSPSMKLMLETGPRIDGIYHILIPGAERNQLKEALRGVYSGKPGKGAVQLFQELDIQLSSSGERNMSEKDVSELLRELDLPNSQLSSLRNGNVSDQKVDVVEDCINNGLSIQNKELDIKDFSLGEVNVTKKEIEVVVEESYENNFINTDVSLEYKVDSRVLWEDMLMEADEQEEAYLMSEPVEDVKVSKIATITFCCKECGKSFSQDSSLEEHIKSLHVNIEKQVPMINKYNCNFCVKTFKSAFPLKQHMRKSHETNMRRENLVAELRKAQNCGCSISLIRPFKNNKATILHYRSDHVNVPAFPCQKCTTIFSIFDNEERLNIHMIKKHSEYNCQQCDYQSSIRKDLLLHQRKIHKDIDRLPRTCNICNFLCKTKGALIMHRRHAHPSEATADKTSKPSKEITYCELCGKESRNLKLHMSTHSDKKWPCTRCEREFSTKWTVRKHEMTMHSTVLFPCTQCEKTFRREEYLSQHTRNIHLPDSEKPFQCNMCGKGFLNNLSLGAHMTSVHLKDTPHSCRYDCGRAYNDSSNRNVHEKKVHGSIHISAIEALKKANRMYNPGNIDVMASLKVRGDA